MSNFYQAATHLLQGALFGSAIAFTGAGVWNLQQPAPGGETEKPPATAEPVAARSEPEVTVGEVTVVPPVIVPQAVAPKPVLAPKVAVVPKSAVAPKSLAAAKPVVVPQPAPLEPALKGMRRTCEDRVMNSSGDKVKICTWHY